MYSGAPKLKFPHILTPEMVLKRCRSCLASAGHVNLVCPFLSCCVAFHLQPRGFQRLHSNFCLLYVSELLGKGRRRK